MGQPGRPKGSVRWDYNKSPQSNPAPGTKLKSTVDGRVRVVIRKIQDDIDYYDEADAAKTMRTCSAKAWRYWCMLNKVEILDNPWESEL